MIDTTEAKVDQLIIHRVGNKVRDERYTKSNALIHIKEHISQTLLNYFLSPFLGNDEVFNFTHPSSLTLNEVYTYSKNIFTNEESFIEESHNILIHLYEQSTHPKISEGDLFIVLFSGIKFDNRKIKTVGIFKAERKETFFKTILNKNVIDLNTELGISAKQLDKGCLIFNLEKTDGYKILSIDTNGYDTQYWIDSFLQIKNAHSSNFNTKNYLKLCKDFGNDYIETTFDKKGKIIFLNKSLEYFNRNEIFDLDDFAQNVLPDKSSTKEFKKFKQTFEEKNGIDDLNEFEISKVAVKSMRRQFKNFIKLDTNIELKLNFRNPEKSGRFVEKGYDDEKQMYFYKVYFNKEIN